VVVCSTITAGLLLQHATFNTSSARPAAAAIPIVRPGAPAGSSSSSSSSSNNSSSSAARPPHSSSGGGGGGDGSTSAAAAAAQFDLVVIDEAGQGLAPEVLLPMSLAKPQVGVRVSACMCVSVCLCLCF
jgi:hypothetical protein